MRVSMGSLVLVEKITKSVAEQALTHPDIEEQTDTDEVGDEGRAAIAKEGQGDSHNRQDTGDHGDVNKYLPKDHRRNPYS
jgi:hypothetical protein